MDIYSAATGASYEEIERTFDGKGYGAFKQAVGEAVVEMLRPIQEKYAAYMQNKDYLAECWRAGAEQASRIANKTLQKVMRKVGFVLD